MQLEKKQGSSSFKKNKSEERFKLLVESVLDYAIFMLGTDGIILTWNAGAELIKGYKAHEIIGQHFSVFYLPEDKAKPAMELKEAEETGVYKEEGWRVRKDGRKIWASVVITALRNEDGKLTGFAKVTRDMTERLQAEEKLRQSEEKFRLLVQTVQDYAIFMLDPTGKIMTWNAGAERVKGYKADEIIGQHFSAFYLPEDKAKPAMELKEAEGKGVYKEEGWRVRKDGKKIWAYVVITALRDENGKLRGFVKVTRDMTERKNSEEALSLAYKGLEEKVRQRTQELQAYSEELARSNADLQQFAFIASHDLQEPLRMVSMYVDLLNDRLRDSLNTDTREYLRYVQEGAMRAQRLINELLEYSKIGAGNEEFSKVSMREVLRRVTSLLHVSIKETEAIITHDPLPDIYADHFQMEQLLQNLITNAIKYRSKHPPIIHISAEKTGSSWVFGVKDNGLGIAPKFKDNIFIIFKRLHSTKHYPGTGIGLALCKKIVERHGGKIWVESKEGEGSTFFFRLPEKPAENPRDED